MRRWLVSAALLASCAATSPLSPETRAQLAPSGTLRVAINYGNPVLAMRNAQTGELRGVAVDLGRELARRSGLPVELVAYASVARLMADLKAGAWDVAFLAVDPARAGEVAFTAPYMEVEVTYMVPEQSGARSLSDVDRAGMRVSVQEKNAADLFLSRSLKQATVVRAADEAGALALLTTGRANVLASNTQRLLAVAEANPGYRIIPGRFTTVEHALGVPAARDAAAAYVRRFIEEAKASGLVKRALDGAGVRGVVVAPPA